MAKNDPSSSPASRTYSASDFMPSSSPPPEIDLGMSSSDPAYDEAELRTPRAQRRKFGRRRPRTMHQKVLRVLRSLSKCGLSLIQFLNALFYGDKDCISDPAMVQVRRGFASSELLPVLLGHILDPPHRAATRRGRVFKGARAVLVKFAFDTVYDRLASELKRYECKTASDATVPIDGDSLLDISMDGVVRDFEEHCPQLVALVRNVMTSKNALRRRGQRHKLHRRNITGVICSMVLFARSQRQNQLQRKLSIYMKAKGTPRRVFDFLQSVGITLSYSWTLEAIDTLADAALLDMREWIATKAAIVNMDNVLLVYPVQSQRIDNRTETINATACTVIKLPLHALATLNSYGTELAALRASTRILRVTNPDALPRLSFSDFVTPAADERLAKLHVYYILRVLVDAPGFETFVHRDDGIFAPPPATRQLPTGPEHRTQYYMLPTEPIDEISYEGTKRCITAFMKHMGLDTEEARRRYGTEAALPWGGDGLTTARMRALQRYCVDARNGWDRYDWLVQYSCLFHEYWWVGIDIHHNHYGTSVGNGLGREIKFLDRNGMAASKKKPDFHTLDEMITQFWTASTLDCWLWHASCTSLPELLTWANRCTAEELHASAETIFFERQSSAALADLDDRQRRNSSDTDDTLYARILANRDMAFYLTLRRSIKQGDIGVYMDSMPRLLAFYKGSGNTHYARELYESMQFLFKEASPAMRDFVFDHCLLVNLSGQPGRFMPTGQLQEHNNDKIKNNHSTHSASSSMELVKRVSSALPVMDAICKDVDTNFTQLYHGTHHSAPNADRDIARMLSRFTEAGVHQFKAGRTSGPRDKPVDVIRKGLQELQSNEYLDECWEAREVFLRYASHAQDFDLPPCETTSTLSAAQAEGPGSSVSNDPQSMDSIFDGLSWNDIAACDDEMEIDLNYEC